jgi:flagellar hook protein FlgE
VKMIFYQRAYQANSRLIQAASEMLDVLVNL